MNKNHEQLKALVSNIEVETLISLEKLINKQKLENITQVFGLITNIVVGDQDLHEEPE